jgi:hypothetical protein
MADFSTLKFFDVLKEGTEEAKLFPAVGNRYEVDYGGDFVVQFYFHSINSMTIYGTKGEYKDFSETVEIKVTPVRSGVFMVAWQEHNKTSVLHVEDFENNIIYANITLPGNNFVRMQGNFRQVK